MAPHCRRILGRASSTALCLMLGCGPSVGGDSSASGASSASQSDETTVGSGTTLATTPAAESTTTPDDPTTGSSGEPATTGAVPEPCFPAELRGALIPELSVVPGITAYEGCGDNELLLEYTGEPLAIGFDEVAAIRDQTTLFIGGVPGHWGIGTGLCCLDDDAICITLMAEPETDLLDLIDYVDSSIPQRVTQCFGLTVRLGEPPSTE